MADRPVVHVPGADVPLPEPTELEAMYGVADDHEADVLEALSVRAGLRWKCQRLDAQGIACGWVGHPDESKCDFCGTPRQREET